MPNDKTYDIDQIVASTNGRKIHYFDSVDSTNTWLLKHGQCGDICISDTQTSGRGRRGNAWVSPSGNIHFSICGCFEKNLAHWSLLGLVIGVAIAEALSDIGLTNHGVKWPNDIFWEQKKMGGILLETIDQSGKVVIGIGININLPDNANKMIGQPSTSLEEAMGHKETSRNQLVVYLINRLQKKLNEFKCLNFEQFIKSWQTWDILQGKHINFNHQGLKVSGEVMGIDKMGRLEILTDSGEHRFYSSADIKINKNRGHG